MPCKCHSLSDLAVVDMAHPGGVMDTLEEVAERGEPFWWLEASRCSSCGTGWLVGHEERQNDVFVLRRLTEAELQQVLTKRIWPAEFDHYEVLLRHGREAGHSVRWLEPLTDSALLETAVDLARQRPGMRVSELCELLNIDPLLASQLAELANATRGVDIRCDIDSWQ